MMSRPHLPVAALALALGLGASPSASSTWVPAERPLAPGHPLATDVAASDAIGVGHITAVHDTVLPGDSRVPRRARTIAVQFEKWLLGDPGEDILEIALARNDPEPIGNLQLVDAARDARSMVFLLRRTGTGWVLASGVRAPSAEKLPELERTIVGAIASNHDDSLLVEADAVVIGSPIAGDDCSDDAGPCVWLALERVVGGAWGSRRVAVHLTASDDPPAERAVYILRKIGKDEYETLGDHDAWQRMAGRRLSRWGLDIDELDLRIRALHERRNRKPTIIIN